jgi:adenylate cyclase
MTATRRLAAILVADVVGYARLMEGDETGTLAALKERRNTILEPVVKAHGGRIVKVMGDGLLIEFASAVNAVRAALEFQERYAEANQAVAEGRRIALRIGINLGDVIGEGDDIFGDGVNVAARLEALAEPGGVCISAKIHAEVLGKVEAGFIDIGEQKLKNMTAPVRAFRSAAAGGGETARVPATAQSRPSIAVLPFQNMSGDPEQDYFAEGISEDIITEISKFRSLFVISRNSTFAFKNRSVSLKELSARLGARYIVEGSVRRAGNRLRITAQLIDAMDDSHLWAERYDRQLQDMFDVQDEVVRAIVAAIEPQLQSSEAGRASRKPPDNLDAWENYQRGLWHVFRYRREEREATLAFFERAIALDPRFAPAHAGLSYAYYTYIILGSSPDAAADRERALIAGKTAVGLDEYDPFAYVALARAHILQADHAAALTDSDKAIRLNPSFALAHFGRGHCLWHQGRAAEATAPIDEAMRLSPNDPVMWAFMASKAIALVLTGDLDQAISCSRQAQQQNHAAIFAHVGEVCAFGLQESGEEAADAVKRARLKMPDVSVAHLDKVLPITHPPSRVIFLRGLRQAGLPE